MTRFTDKTVLITGAASGIGAAAARLFSAEGANVVLLARTAETLEQVAAELPRERTAVHVGDVADPATATQSVARAVETFGGLDVLVNNAGTVVMGDIAATSLEDYARVMDVNVGGYFRMAKAALSELRKTRSAIVMTSSASGRGGDWEMLAYNISKGAVDNMVRAMALDHGREGVRVNAVSPSFTETTMTRDMTDPALIEKFMARIPMRRTGQPEDVARVIAFLAGADAGFVTGVMIPVDGGLSASNGQPDMTG